jgi:hypothetical protein
MLQGAYQAADGDVVLETQRSSAIMGHVGIMDANLHTGNSLEPSPTPAVSLKHFKQSGT